MPIGVKTIYIDSSFKNVYDFCRNPENLGNTPLGMPDNGEVVGNGDAGTMVRFPFSINGKSSTCLLEIIETNIDDKGFKTKYKLISELEGEEIGATQTEIGMPKGRGCEFTVVYEYTIPDSLLENPAEKQSFEKNMENDYFQSLNKLKRSCEALK
jgi:hypothetical protein